MKQEKSCGVIAFQQQENTPHILLICHRYGGHWAFPKGHVEQGETEEQTALRELEEETGMQAMLRSGYREITTYSPARGVRKDVVMFVGEIYGGTLRAQPEEVRALALVPYEEALTRLTYLADRQLLEKAKPFLAAAQDPAKE